jgi:hypothetical protein
MCCCAAAAAGGEVSYAEHIAPLRAAGGAELRCVLVSATLPQHTFDELQELFMGLGAAFGPGLHRTATGERRKRPRIAACREDWYGDCILVGVPQSCLQLYLRQLWDLVCSAVQQVHSWVNAAAGC